MIRKKVLLGLFGLTLAWAGAALAEDPKPPEAPVSNWLVRIGEVLKKIGWARMPGSDSFRDGNEGSPSEDDLQVWTLSVKGGTPRRLTDDAGYAWPVYGPDGKSIAALTHDGVVVLEPSKQRRVVFAKPADDPPFIVVSWTTLGISVLTASGRVVLIDPVKEEGLTVDRVGPGMISALVQSTRSCQDVYVSSVEALPDAAGRRGRSDVLLHTKVKSKTPRDASAPAPELYASRNLTERLKTTRHTEPAMSPDCKQIVFVGAP